MGLAQAQFFMGAYHEAGGLGVPRDYELAKKWYALAAEQGLPEAQERLSALGGFKNFEEFQVGKDLERL